MAVRTGMRDRVRADVVRLAHQQVGTSELVTALSRTLERVMPAEGWCLLTLDPATLLPTGEVVTNGLPDEVRPRLAEIELFEPDVNKIADVARRPIHAASLSSATEGDLDRSLRHRELRRPSGFDDELRVALTDGSVTWGALTLMRERGRPPFTDADVRFVASLSATLAEAVRATTVPDPTSMTGHEHETGLLVLSDDNTVVLANDAAGRWLEELGGDLDGGLPVAVRAVAAQTRHVRDGADTTRLARARATTRAGRVAVVRGSLLGERGDRTVGVVVEAARAPELAPLIADAYGLTPRERAITELIAQGLSTKEISARLHLAAYTVQDHLKSIFDKSGTSSRGELVARLFFEHYAPRLDG